MPYLASSSSFTGKVRDLMNHRKTSRRAGRRSAVDMLLEPIEPRRLLSVSTSWVEVPISASAKTADSTLSNYRTFDLRVSVTSGDDWVGGNMKVSLSSGRLYIPASSNSNGPQQSLWSSKPNLQ